MSDRIQSHTARVLRDAEVEAIALVNPPGETWESLVHSLREARAALRECEGRLHYKVPIDYGGGLLRLCCRTWVTYEEHREDCFLARALGEGTP